jgi:TonB-dependent receptor
LLDGFHTTYLSHYGLNRYIELQDYDAGEDIYAAYLMAELNFGDQITVLPGFRYERTNTEYVGRWGYLGGNLGEVGTINDTTGGQEYGDLLPMVHVRYRVTPWFDIRLAYTQSLSRPDYFNLVPYEQINFSEQRIVRGNPEIKHTQAINYDVYVSFYSNDLGLLTLGGYYKKLTNIDYIKQSRVTGGEFNAFLLTEPVNGDESNVWGVEIDVQTNLKNLPSPFDGFVINVNYSYIRSETYFPFFEIGPRSPDPPYSPQIIDTFRKGTLPGQADHIGNVALGYEKGGFSGRVSATVQGKSLQTVGARAELDGYTNNFVRWDATLSQRFSPFFSIYLDVNNFTNQPEEAFLGEIIYPTNQEYFSWTADIGVRLNF